MLAQLRAGVTLDDGPVTVSSARLVSVQGERSIVELVIHEGRNRIVAAAARPRRPPRPPTDPHRHRPRGAGHLGQGELRDLIREELASCSTTPSSDEPRSFRGGRRATPQPQGCVTSSSKFDAQVRRGFDLGHRFSLVVPADQVHRLTLMLPEVTRARGLTSRLHHFQPQG